MPGLLQLLAERLPPADLQSLLLEVVRRRAAAVTGARLLQEYGRDRFVGPASVDPRRLVELDRLAFSLLPEGWEPLELAPVCPLGTTSAVAPTDQHRVVTTVRGSEVVADATNVLALECAVRRRELLRADVRHRGRVRLAASHRMLRAQPFDWPGARQHFRLWAMVTAGRDEGSFRFEVEALTEHLAFYAELLGAAGAPSPRVAITDLEDGLRTPALERDVLIPLSARHPAVEWTLDPARTAGRGYYVNACFEIRAAGVQFVDGGFTTWTRRLLSNHKERLLISGLGTDRLCELVGP